MLDQKHVGNGRKSLTQALLNSRRTMNHRNVTAQAAATVEDF